MTEQRYEGQVNGGRFNPDLPDSFKEGVASFEGNFVLVTIDKLRNTRSNQQNKYLWLVYGMIAEESGHTSEEIHEACKMKFLPRQFEMVNKSTGETETLTIPKSTTKLTTVAFSEYVEQIRAFAASFYGLSIPDPQ